MTINKKSDVSEIFSIILDSKEISLCKQRILEILSNSGDKISDGVEILSRLGNEKKSPCSYLSQINDELKVEFDFIVFEKLLDLYNNGKLEGKTIHVNVHPVTLLDVNFKFNLFKLCKKYDFKDFDKLYFEILENGKIDNIDLLNYNIWSLRSVGCKVGLDDYPNENNNNEILYIIKELDFVKIDKSFLLSLKIKKPDELAEEIQKLVSEIRAVHPDVSIILEGVENNDIYNFVVDKLKGINGLQGYYFGLPEKI